MVYAKVLKKKYTLYHIQKGIYAHGTLYSNES